MKLDAAALVALRDSLLRSGRRPTLVVSAAFETLARSGMLSAEESAAIQLVDPIVEAMFLTISADGELSEPERDALRGAIRALTDGVVRSGTMTVMLEDYETRVRDEGEDARLQAVSDALEGDSRQAEAAFALSAALAYADDRIGEEESRVLRRLADVLGLPESRREQLLADLDRLRGD